MYTIHLVHGTNRYLIALFNESVLLSYCTYESILRLLFTEGSRSPAWSRYYNRETHFPVIRPRHTTLTLPPSLRYMALQMFRFLKPLNCIRQLFIRRPWILRIWRSFEPHVHQVTTRSFDEKYERRVSFFPTNDRKSLQLGCQCVYAANLQTI